MSEKKTQQPEKNIDSFSIEFHVICPPIFVFSHFVSLESLISLKPPYDRLEQHQFVFGDLKKHIKIRL